MKNYIVLMCLICVAACGFRPLYGVNRETPVGAEARLAQVDIANIPDREGQYLRNALIDRFYHDGRPADARYSLVVQPVRESRINLDITKDADATRGQLRMDTSMILADRQTGETLVERSVRSITSYNILGSEFATRVTEDNARQNALDDLAAQIELQISLYFKAPPSMHLTKTP